MHHYNFKIFSQRRDHCFLTISSNNIKHFKTATGSKTKIEKLKTCLRLKAPFVYCCPALVLSLTNRLNVCLQHSLQYSTSAFEKSGLNLFKTTYIFLLFFVNVCTTRNRRLDTSRRLMNANSASGKIGVYFFISEMYYGVIS